MTDYLKLATEICYDSRKEIEELELDAEDFAYCEGCGKYHLKADMRDQRWDGWFCLDCWIANNFHYCGEDF